MDWTAEHLLEIKKSDLIRKTQIGAFNRQILLQEPKHNNYMMVAYLEEVLNGNLPISAGLEAESSSLNYNDTKLEVMDINFAMWFISPDLVSLNQLSPDQINRIKVLLTLVPVERALIYEDIQGENSFYNGVYYSEFADRLIVEYPGRSQEVYKAWAQTHFD